MAVVVAAAIGLVGVGAGVTAAPDVVRRERPVADGALGRASGDAVLPAAGTDLRAVPVAAQGVVSETLGRHDERFAASAGPEGIAFANPVHELAATVDEGGIAVDAAGRRVGLTLESYGRMGSAGRVAAGTPVAHANRVEIDRGGLREWFVNGPAGVQQGFTLGAPPAGRGRVVLGLVTSGPTVRVDGDGRGVRFRGSPLRYGGLVVTDATGRELAARFSSRGGYLRIVVDDRKAQWPITVDPIFEQQAYFKASNTHAGADDGLGYSVAVQGDTAVIAAPFEDSCSPTDQSNTSCHDAGAVYVFVRSSGTWSQQAYLKASNPGADDQFGWSVAISGDTVVVGAAYEDGNASSTAGAPNNLATEAGAVYVFVRSGTTWSQQAYIKASNTEAGDQLGWFVAISGDTAVVGAPEEDGNYLSTVGTPNNSAMSSGAAYVFVRSGTTWSQQGYLKASNAEAADNFGVAVGVSGDTAVVGAIGEDGSAASTVGTPNNSAVGAGAAYVFVRSGTTWSQQGYLKASNAEAGDIFGFSVGVSGDTAVVGATGEDGSAASTVGTPNNSADGAGAAYVFVRSGTTWLQQGYLKASNADPNDLYGYGVAVSGSTVVVGAVSESSCATGVGGDQTSNACAYVGAAYGYVRRPPAPVIGMVSTPSSTSVSVPFTTGAGNAGNTYSATCASSNGGTTRTTSAAASSPIVVSNLTTAALYTCTVTASGSGVDSAPSAESAQFTPNGSTGTTVTVTVPAKVATGGSFTLSAQLVGSKGVQGKTLWYRFGDGAKTQMPNATDRNGRTSTTVSAPGPAGDYTLWVWFPGDATYKFSSQSAAMTVADQQATNVVLTAPTPSGSTVNAAKATSTTFTASLGLTVSGEVINFKIQQGTTVLSNVNATTNASGVASTSIKTPRTAGSYTLIVSHAAVPLYGQSSTTYSLVLA